MKILLLDNYDSFTRNLEHLLAVSLNTRPRIVPYSAIAQEQPEPWNMIVLSPGPGRPEEYPGYERFLDSGTPVLGICLGMQIINVHFGGKVSRLAGCVHGVADRIVWQGGETDVARYHSLYAAKPAPELLVTAKNADGVPMILEHPTRPVLGFQFHPESFLTTDGGKFIEYACSYFARFA